MSYASRTGLMVRCANASPDVRGLGHGRLAIELFEIILVAVANIEVAVCSIDGFKIVMVTRRLRGRRDRNVGKPIRIPSPLRDEPYQGTGTNGLP